MAKLRERYIPPAQLKDALSRMGARLVKQGPKGKLFKASSGTWLLVRNDGVVEEHNGPCNC